MPFGSIFEGQSLSDVATGLFDLEGAVDVVNFGRWVLGAHIGAGISSAGDGFAQNFMACGVWGACSAWNFDLGIHGEYRFLVPTSNINPWVGLGLSYEMLGASIGADPHVSARFSGADVDFSGGCDFRSGRLGFGPFIGYRVGTYLSGSESVSNAAPGNPGTSIENFPFNALHGWLLLGLRIRY